MKLLLDTHIWIWSVADPKRLSRRVASALRSGRNELWLSPISVWEVLVLVEKGTLRPDRPAEEWVKAALEAPGTLRDAPLTREVAVQSRRIALPHEDPADRFIAATALVHGLTLVTADERLLAVRGLPTLPNR
ncbi:MAG: type II toxin-antitoxin system VapC family toxin [Acidobacteria bacterium]|nr:MAG: type II toxin-antitoxin system VapC family toxin [Acidobacteriota bacterium]MCE7960281.1 type II toxin-antitoxin system VapC family toxin [Acidobacteria bacterium ACB2]